MMGKYTSNKHEFELWQLWQFFKLACQLRLSNICVQIWAGKHSVVLVQSWDKSYVRDGNWTIEFCLGMGRNIQLWTSDRCVVSVDICGLCTQQHFPCSTLVCVSYRVLSRDHTTPPDMELATPVSDLVSSSVCPSQWPGGNTDVQLSASSPDSQVCWAVYVFWLRTLPVDCDPLIQV